MPSSRLYNRLFEANFPLEAPPCACASDKRPIIDVSGGGPTHAPRLDGGGGRTYKGTVEQKRRAMDISWMTGGELVEAIPPAYTALIAPQIPVMEASLAAVRLVGSALKQIGMGVDDASGWAEKVGWQDV